VFSGSAHHSADKSCPVKAGAIADKQSERRPKKCPYDFFTKDGRVFIDGEDFGTEHDFHMQGNKLSRLVSVWHEVKTGCN